MLPKNTQTPAARQARSILLVVICLLLVLIGYNIYRAFQFHLVGSTPGKTSISTISPYVTLNFNQTLVSGGAQVDANPGVFSSYAISGKSITFNLATPLTTGKNYAITIHSLASTKGSKITTVVFSFKTKVIPFQKLPQDQQAAILKNQTARTPSRDSITYEGTNTLLDHGISATQVNDLKQALFNFTQIQHKTVSTVTLTNPVFIPFDPHGTSGVASSTFSVTFDSGSPYNATFSFSGLSTGRLLLVTPTSGQQVYDSGDIDLQNGS